MYFIVSKKPSECSTQELEQFAKLVMAGGEVANGLPARVQRAVSLVMLFSGEELVGTAGLKRPEAGYQNKVFLKARTDKGPADFNFELGWVYIAPEHRNSKKAMPLIEAAMKASDEAPIFATARENNGAMHHLLKKVGFTLSGGSYASKQNAGQKIVLFVTDASCEKPADSGDRNS